MKMLNCPECGLTITNTQKECPKCRTQIEEIKEETGTEKIKEEAKTEEIKEKTNTKEIKEEANTEEIKAIEEKKEAKKKTGKKNLTKLKKKLKKKNDSVDVNAEAETHETITTEEEVIDDAINNDSAKIKEEMIAAVVEAEALAAIEEEESAPEETLCATCMAPVEDGQNFCQLCGSSVEAIEEIINPVIPKTDEESNKLIAAIGYVCFLFPILCGYHHKSAFAKFHAKQATLLFRASVILFIGLIISLNLLEALFSIGWLLTLYQHGLGVLFYYYLISMINLLYLTPFALMLIGIINAFRGKKKKLPIINRPLLPMIKRLLTLFKSHKKDKTEKIK